ncbi:MAG: T9SS type A sorting domain-containing protein [Bacteroidia bacterium]
MRLATTVIVFFAAQSMLFGQVAKEQVLALIAKNDNGNIGVHWQADASFTGNYSVSRRAIGESAWNQLATTSDTFYVDNDISLGEAYEFMVVKQIGAQTISLGYSLIGFEYVPSPFLGEAVILLDSIYINDLESEVEIFSNDLELEGWQVKTLYAGRNENVNAIKARIVDAATENTEALIIVGHVPVPYSGNFTRFGISPPDGHIEGAGNHTGAWAADAFYGDIDGEWTDNTANHVDANLKRGKNVPGDGKFDQTKLPSEVELQVGRIDFYDMPAFSKTELELLKDYFKRNHAYRVGEWKIEERALIDNNFVSFNLASTGYHNFSCFYESELIDETADYVEAQREEGYLWSYGCGAGSFTSCNGLFNGRARTSDIAADTLNNVFTILAGSYFGDWDITDNFLRAPLCNKSLVSFWGGLPKWYIHHMALGWNIGFGARISMNNVDDYFNGNFNNAQNSIHIALMGDPTLTMHGISRPTNLSATSSGNDVMLNWTAASGDIDGYFIYRWDENGNMKRVNNEVITNTNYTDESNWFSGDYQYSVRAAKLYENPSGSYFKLSGGDVSEVSHVNSVSKPTELEIDVFPSPANDVVTIFSKVNENLQVEVYNAAGQFIYKGAFVGNTQIDVSEFESGIYLVKTFSKKGAIGYSRFVKL